MIDDSRRTPFKAVLTGAAPAPFAGGVYSAGSGSITLKYFTYQAI